MNKLLYLLMALLVMAGACKKNQDHTQQPLAVTSFFPTSGLAHTLVTVYGAGFGADTMHNTVTFNAVKASILQVTDTSLVVLAPDGGSTGPVAVTSSGKTITAGSYTYQLLSLHSVSPLNGPAGTSVVISGAGLSGKTGPAAVSFNGRPAIVVSSNDTSLVAAVPDSAGVGPIVVTVDASTATGPSFVFQGISFITPTTGGAGTLDSIHGTGFGVDATKDIVAFNGVAATVLSAADTMIVAKVPAAVSTGPVSVTINGQRTIGPVFTVVAAPVITSMTPSSGLAGATVTIAGKNFSVIASQNKVDFNGAAAVVSAASATQLTVTVPASATTGHINVTVNGQSAQGPVFTIQLLNITALTPDNGLEGTTVVITGNGFSATAADNQVFFNGIPATVTAATSTQLTVKAPVGFTTGAVTITSGGLMAAGPVFSHAGVQTIYQNLSASINGLAVDLSGNVYFTESIVGGSNTNRIMKLSADGSSLTTFAGSETGQAGHADANGTSALFNNPGMMAFDPQGNLYVVDAGNSGIRMVSPSGDVSTVTTGITGINGLSFDAQGKLYFGASNYGGTSGLFVLNGGAYTAAYPGSLNVNPSSIAVDGLGGLYYINGYGNNQLVEYRNGTTKTITSSLGSYGDWLGTDPVSGNVIVADQTNAIFWSVDESTGVITPLFKAISNYVGPPVDGNLSQSSFMGVKQITVDHNGVFYVIDGGNQQQPYIRKIFFH